MARSEKFTLSYKIHATDQLNDRGLFIGDVLYLLRNGFVFKDPVESTRKEFYKYQMEYRTPNSGQRDVRIVIIPDWDQCEAKIATIMWADEPMVTG